MGKFLTIAVFCVFVAAGVYWMIRPAIFHTQKRAGEIASEVMNERVTLLTADNKSIVGDYSGKAGLPAVVLLHMMPATRESWRAFSEKLNAAGFQTLAIDLRGHGESEGGPSGYKKFSDKEHQSSIRDVEAAVSFLEQKQPAKIFIAGASIGANLALEYAAGHPEISRVVLLSPGLDYRGIKTADMPSLLRAGQAVYYVASKDDTYSAGTVETLSRSTPHDVVRETKIFEKAGHGTTIFEREPSFMEEIISWLGR